MPATPSHRQLTVAERPGVLAKTFWELAGAVPDASDPIAVARSAARALEALERTDGAPHVTAATLSFLLRLDGDRIYAAPEQARGDSTGQRSLVFTVGVLVFEKLTGQHPFGVVARAGDARTADDERIPPELRAALETAMAPFPADRWSSLHALRGELERIVDRDRSLVVEMRRARRRSVPPPCPGSAVRRFARGSRPAPIPSAPAMVDDEEELDLDRSPSAVGPAQTAQAAAVAAHRSTAVASTAPHRARVTSAPMVDVELLESKPWHAVARALVLMSVGAGLALTAVWLTQRPMDAVGTPVARTPAVVSRAPVELPAIVVQLAEASAASASPVVAPEQEIAEQEIAEQEIVEQPIVEQPIAEQALAPAGERSAEPAPAAFDPNLAGDAALSAMRDCFSEQRLRRGVELSASLRFGREDERSDRVYFAPAQVLDDGERSCVRERLTGLSAGAAPAHGAVVSYTFWLSPQRTRFWAKAPR